MYDLANFSDADVATCGDAMRSAAAGASSMEEASYRMVRVLYENILDPATGETATALVRFYKTHPYDQLDAELQQFARGLSRLRASRRWLALPDPAGHRRGYP